MWCLWSSRSCRLCRSLSEFSSIGSFMPGECKMLDTAGHVQTCVDVVGNFVTRARASAQNLRHSTPFEYCPFGTCIVALPSKLTTGSQTCLCHQLTQRHHCQHVTVATTECNCQRCTDCFQPGSRSNCLARTVMALAVLPFSCRAEIPQSVWLPQWLWQVPPSQQ